MIFATLCYVRKDDSTLMLKVEKQGMNHGKYNGLGGKLEAGETPEECCIREVFEESGLKIKNPHLKGILTFPKFHKDEDWYVFVFVVNDFYGDLKESQEGKLEWVKTKDLHLLNLHDGDKYFLPWLDKKGFFSAKFNYKNGHYVNHKVFFYS